MRKIGTVVLVFALAGCAAVSRGDPNKVSIERDVVRGFSSVWSDLIDTGPARAQFVVGVSDSGEVAETRLRLSRFGREWSWLHRHDVAVNADGARRSVDASFDSRVESASYSGAGVYCVELVAFKLPLSEEQVILSERPYTVAIGSNFVTLTKDCSVALAATLNRANSLAREARSVSPGDGR